ANGTEFANWYAAFDRNKRKPSPETLLELQTIEAGLKNRSEQPINPDKWSREGDGLLTIINAYKTDVDLPFRVVFQKALFLAFRDFCASNADLPSVLAEFQDDDLDGYECLDAEGEFDIGEEQLEDDEPGVHVSVTFDERLQAAATFVEALNLLHDATQG